MKTLKSLTGLLFVFPAMLPVVLGVSALHLRGCHEMRQSFFEAAARDWRTLQPSREVAAAVFMAVILLILGLGAVAHFVRAEWWQGTFDMVVALFLASRE